MFLLTFGMKLLAMFADQHRNSNGLRKQKDAKKSSVSRVTLSRSNTFRKKGSQKYTARRGLEATKQELV